ncbi:MAG: hypothetical protein IKO27_09100 [Ruminococcus sp.]|nr:hypothetical protein [Ruminococcus sp.]
MAEMTELERVKQASEFIHRYAQFEDAVTVNQQNKVYLQGYIRNQYDVEKEFDFKHKVIKALGIGAGVGVVLGLIVFGASGSWIAGLISLGVFALLGAALGFFVQRYRLSEAIENQRDVNNGIKEQIEVLELRDKQLIRQRDDYYRGLQKRIDFMSMDYMDSIDQIVEIIENGEAETCEDAVAVFEQKQLFSQMTSLISAPEKDAVPLDRNKAKEMFGDPLEQIRETRRKRRKEQKADSLFSI